MNPLRSLPLSSNSILLQKNGRAASNLRVDWVTNTGRRLTEKGGLLLKTRVSVLQKDQLTIASILSRAAFKCQ